MTTVYLEFLDIIFITNTLQSGSNLGFQKLLKTLERGNVKKKKKRRGGREEICGRLVCKWKLIYCGSDEGRQARRQWVLSRPLLQQYKWKGIPTPHLPHSCFHWCQDPGKNLRSRRTNVCGAVFLSPHVANAFTALTYFPLIFETILITLSRFPSNQYKDCAKWVYTQHPFSRCQIVGVEKKKAVTWPFQRVFSIPTAWHLFIDMKEGAHNLSLSGKGCGPFEWESI